MVNCCALVVWYNPSEEKDNKAVEAILSYVSYFPITYIIDNSDCDNSFLTKKIQNVIYVANNKNLGIATALNQGCELAKKDGFEWIMTMDQDSSFEQSQLETYISLVENNLCNKKIKSFTLEQKDIGDRIVPLSKWIRFPIKRFFVTIAPKQQPSTEFVNHTITSANIINLAAWEGIGKFDDKLFIDEVDIDFCIRLKIHNYDILKFNNCYVNHELGKRTFSIFQKIQYESDFRLFYIFRNLMIENYRYGKLPFSRNYKKEIWCYFRDYCIVDTHPVRHLKIFFKARKAYKDFISENIRKNKT